MSIPRRHHYLPQFYLNRWAIDDLLWRFERPEGPSGEVHAKSKSPGATGYERDLYATEGIEDPTTRQRIELKFFQIIDDRAAAALQKIEAGEKGEEVDKVGLIQFLLSILHRSPSRIEWMQERLFERTAGLWEEGKENETELRNATLDILVDLTSSGEMIELLFDFRVFHFELEAGARDMMTSDRPAMLSNGLQPPGGFLMFPTGPRRLLILTKEERVASAFFSQEHKALSKAVNDAVVRQARHVVISTSKDSKRFVENRFLRENMADQSESANDGLVRWQVP